MVHASCEGCLPRRSLCIRTNRRAPVPWGYFPTSPVRHRAQCHDPNWLAPESALHLPKWRVLRPWYLSSVLPSVIGPWFWMNQNPEQLRRFLLEPGFQFGLDVMHTWQRHLVGHSAVARDVQTAAHALHLHV